MPLKTDTDRRLLARAIELAEGGRGKVSPNPLVGAVVAIDDEPVSEGFHQELGGAHAEVEAIRAAGGRDLSGGDDLHLARAVLPSRAHAAVHRRDPRGGHRPRRRRLRRSVRARVGPGARDPPRRRHRGRGRRRRARDPGAAPQPALSQACPHRAAVGAVQVGDVARRQGRDPRAATRNGSPASRAGCSPTTGGPSATPSRSGSAPRSPTIRSSPRASAAFIASRAGSCSTRSGGCRLTRSSCATRAGSRSRSSSPAPLRAPRPTRSRPTAST